MPLSSLARISFPFIYFNVSSCRRPVSYPATVHALSLIPTHSYIAYSYPFSLTPTPPAFPQRSLRPAAVLVSAGQQTAPQPLLHMCATRNSGLLTVAGTGGLLPRPADAIQQSHCTLSVGVCPPGSAMAASKRAVTACSPPPALLLHSAVVVTTTPISDALVSVLFLYFHCGVLPTLTCHCC